MGQLVALIGYACVSTPAQKRSLQHDALERAGCEHVFDDQASGARTDRLGRSLSHLIEKIGELAARGIGFRSLTENIDTTTPGGMLVFNIFGLLTQFERDLIRERTLAGLRAARERGSKGGRRPLVTRTSCAARAHIAAGLTVREAAARLKTGKTALYKALERTALTAKT